MELFFKNIIADIGLNDILDILVVAFVSYKMIGFIRQSRAGTLVKGVLLILIATWVSDLLDLYTVNWILSKTLSIGIIALLIVFQPELRRAIERIGRKSFIKPVFSHVDSKAAEELANTLVTAVVSMAETRTGALIVIEKSIALLDICETGIRVDAKITPELIGNIFYEGSPLHDGAVIIRNERIHSAGCVLPLTQNKNLASSFGTRHRAGIGITENSDAITIIVSEETGKISLAQNGMLETGLSAETLRKVLLACFLGEDEKTVVGNVKTAIDKIGGSQDVSK